MDCPKCGAIMYIMDSKLTARHDDTPDEKTEIVRVTTLQCHNKACGHTEKIERIINNQE